MKVKEFSDRSFVKLADRLNSFFEELEKNDYEIWHISNVVRHETSSQWFRILVFYDEEVRLEPEFLEKELGKSVLEQ